MSIERGRKAERATRVALNHLTRRIPGLVTDPASSDLEALLRGVFLFAEAFLDCEIDGLFNQIADRHDLERNTLDSLMRSIVAKQVEGMREGSDA